MSAAHLATLATLAEHQERDAAAGRHALKRHPAPDPGAQAFHDEWSGRVKARIERADAAAQALRWAIGQVTP